MVLEFIGTCVGLRAEDLWDYDDSSRDIKYETFRKHVGKNTIKELTVDFGYGKHLKLKDDWAVSYSIGKWKGKKAICMYHSCIHHLWYLPRKI